MKREQIEKIAQAMAGLLEAVEGARSFHVSRRDGLPMYFSIRGETDEDVRAFAGALGVGVDRHVFDDEYYLCGRLQPADGLVINVTGPYHPVEKPLEIDDAKVDEAVAQAEAAIGGTP